MAGPAIGWPACVDLYNEPQAHRKCTHRQAGRGPSIHPTNTKLKSVFVLRFLYSLKLMEKGRKTTVKTTRRRDMIGESPTVWRRPRDGHRGAGRRFVGVWLARRQNGKKRWCLRTGGDSWDGGPVRQTEVEITPSLWQPQDFHLCSGIGAPNWPRTQSKPEMEGDAHRALFRGAFRTTCSSS